MKRSWALAILLGAASTAGFLLFSVVHGTVGFALDDAWIHQVYARNLATRGEFAFFAGQPSAGSTSPLWTILLAVGYILRLDPLIWTYVLGAVLLGASAVVAARLAERVDVSASSFTASPVGLLAALSIAFEWHMAWSAASGMEIPLFVLLSLLLVDCLLRQGRAIVMGILAGLLFLTRPEGIVLAGLVGLALVLRQREIANPAASVEGINRVERGAAIAEGARRGLVYGVGLIALVVPYAIFNVAVSGTLFPNTFYAKAAEYSILFDRASFVVRWLQLLETPWVGAQILLVPGFVYVAVLLVRNKQWAALVPVAWVFLLPALYAFRLPVAYQHGRYEMPVIPFILVYGLVGSVALLTRMRLTSQLRMLASALTASAAVLLAAFWFLGANAYASDVAIIDCEMVQTARWVAANAPKGSVVAAHDIGALGYYYDGPIVDMAGLVTPDVIPFIRDQGRLRDYLLSRQATLAVFFPDWYPRLAEDPDFAPVHRQDCPATRQAGGTDLVVYTVASGRR
ncbi:MAG: hypothetical protein M1132_06300 [Chloroflexi bacterium]|nr:hypothetical protein [Chloroflexota bacterium]